MGEGHRRSRHPLENEAAEVEGEEGLGDNRNRDDDHLDVVEDARKSHGVAYHLLEMGDMDHTYLHDHESYHVH